MDVLENDEMDAYAKGVRTIVSDLVVQMEDYEQTVGDTRDAYKKVILDKLWKLSQYVGEHYHKSIGTISELEAKFLGENPAYPLDSEKKVTFSDTPSVVIKSVPSLPSHSS